MLVFIINPFENIKTTVIPEDTFNENTQFYEEEFSSLNETTYDLIKMDFMEN